MRSDRLEAYLGELERELRESGLASARALEEARGHLVDAVDEGLRRGLSIENAEREALDRFGATELVARHFAAGRYHMVHRLLWAATRLTHAASISPARAIRFGVILLAPGALFLLAVVLKEGLGIGVLFAPIDAFISVPYRQGVFNLVSPVVILGGLTTALLLNCLSIARIELEWTQGRLVSTVAVEPRVANVMLIATVALVLATFVAYAFVENYAIVSTHGG